MKRTMAKLLSKFRGNEIKIGNSIYQIYKLNYMKISWNIVY